MNEKDLELEELSLEEIMREFGSTEEMAEPVDAQELLAMFNSAAEPETEQEPENERLKKNIDILKVGHHGSKTSGGKKFIDEINPKYSIISVGKNNRYGHPKGSVLDNLKSSKIYRTDVDGSIMFKIKNNKLQIETCPP